MALATRALTDMEVRHLDFEQAYLVADIDTEVLRTKFTKYIVCEGDFF